MPDTVNPLYIANVVAVLPVHWRNEEAVPAMPDGAAACLSARAAFLWVGRVRACVRACSAPPLAERASLVRRGMAVFVRANLRRDKPGLLRPVRGTPIDSRVPLLPAARLVRGEYACVACPARSTCLLLACHCSGSAVHGSCAQ